MILAIGLMSGTSRDGIDAALIRTDGVDRVEPVTFHCAPYAADIRDRIADACAIAMSGHEPMDHPKIAACQALLTDLHIDAVRALLSQTGLGAEQIGVIGLHGHTIAHRADLGWTWQIGNPQALADALGIAVVAEMRRFDVKFGGQGAPLIPVYHRAIFADPQEPVVVLNLGGVANLTYIGADGTLLAFDCGMASALIDDWMSLKSNHSFDQGGECAARGDVHDERLGQMLAHPYFAAPAPKSLDRCDFDLRAVADLALADGAATLTAFSAKAVALALDVLPARPSQLIVCGGGRKNATMLAMIDHYAGVATLCSDALGWDGDAIEAQGFAYLAYRCMHGLPITYPGTTGVREPMSGGIVFTPGRDNAARVAA